MSAILPIIPDSRYRIATASSNQTVFTVPFVFQADTDLTIWKIALDGTMTQLARPANYTVTGKGNPGGGSITLKAGVPAGTKILTVGTASRTRANSVTRAGKYDSAATDEDLDRLTIIAQEHDRDLARAAKAPYGVAGPEVVAGEPGTVALWDASGNLVEGPAAEALEHIDTALAVAAGRALVYPEAPAEPVYDAGARRIGNVADGTLAQDVVTKAQLDDLRADVDVDGIDARFDETNDAIAAVVATGFRTGDLKISLFDDDDQEGWLPVDSRTIGSEASGATSRANADTQALFVKMWAKYDNTRCPIQTSAGANTTRGANALADFAANKRLPLLAVGGEFLRFLDRSRGIDVDRELGSAQGEAFKSHTHTATTASNGNHTHGVPVGDNVSDGGYFDASSGGLKWYNQSTSAGAHTHDVTVVAAGGDETRPRNIAFPLYVKL